MKCAKDVRQRLRNAHETHIANFPWWKKQWFRIKYWFNNSSITFAFLSLLVIWPIALIPTWIFMLAWSFLDPVLFWHQFATIVIIGGPAAIIQVVLLLPALILTFGVIAEVFEP